jgi:hypothetical protein
MNRFIPFANQFAIAQVKGLTPIAPINLKVHKPLGSSLALAGRLALCLSWLAVPGFGADNLEMYLDGQLLRGAPQTSTALLVETGSVGRIDLKIPDGGGSVGMPPGVFSFANDRGSFAIRASTTSTKTNTASLRWKGEFTKLPDNVPFTYIVNPSILYLIVPNADPTNHFLASWKLVVKVSGVEWMSSERVIEGFPRLSGPTAFGLTTNTGPIEMLSWDGETSLHDAAYLTRRYREELDLHLHREGLKFTVEYEMSTRLINTLGGESLAEVYIGDPLKYGSGIQINYGSFGELFYLTQLTMDTNRGAIMLIPNEPDFYFILCRRIGLDGPEVPVAMSLGTAGELVDTNPPAVSSSIVLYAAKKVPVAQPLDSDGDGIHDVYELQHADLLDPLNFIDGSEDPDADGYDNLAEFTNGTDPGVPDAAAPMLRFPGIIVPGYPGGELIDLNNDGLLDSAGPGMSVALATPGGRFRAPTNSPVPGTRIVSDSAFLKLDGDAFPDAVVVDLLTNRLFVLRGRGDGSFAPLTDYPAISDPRKIVLCNLNGDSFTDIALLSVNSRGADLHVNNGDGTLTRFATLTTNAYGTARGMALGDFNGDRQDDLVVGYAANAVIFLSQPNGSYGLGQPYPVGSSPESIAVGDLNKDGRLDIVTANRSSDDLSVLLGEPGGTFLPQIRYAVGELPLGLRLADLNGDTFLDVIVARVSVDYQTIFLNQGNGTLAVPYTVPIGNFLGDIADWNGDGNLDLLSGLYSADGLVNLGHGDGTFDTRLQIVPTNSPPTQVSPVDLNGDDRLELVGLNTQLNSIDVWEHSAVTGTNRLRSSFAVGPYVQAFTHGDFNRDGLVDLAVATGTNFAIIGGSNQVVVLTNQGNFTFVEAGHYPLDFRPARIVSADFNGDTIADLTILTLGGTLNGGARLIALTGDGSGGFQVSPPVEVATTISRLEMGDVNGDGHTELLLTGVRLIGSVLSGFTELFALDAAGWNSQQSLVFSNTVGSLKIQSMNGDTYSDLVTTEVDATSGDTALVMYPGGPTGLGARQVLATGVEFQTFSHIVDLNNDGLPDVISFNLNSLFLAKPGGGFHPGQRIWIGTAGIEHVADFNLDGKADLMSGLSILLQE